MYVNWNLHSLKENSDENVKRNFGIVLFQTWELFSFIEVADDVLYTVYCCETIIVLLCDAFRSSIKTQNMNLVLPYGRSINKPLGSRISR